MLIEAGLAVVLIVGFGPAEANMGCNPGDSRDGNSCAVTGSLNGDTAILEGVVGDGTLQGDNSGASQPTDRPCSTELISNLDKCAGGPGRDIPGTLTLSDIAAFRPEVGTNAMQPNGWAIVGLDTNFFSRGGADTVDGTLLGGPAQVRFTPVAWSWSYGDGATKRTGTAGGTWAELGIPEFDATPTSHVYAAKGTYTVALTIDYAAEYRLGAGAWTPIAGVLSLPSNPLAITVGSAKTVLVEEDCRDNPGGPGC